jgi:hypothetical protein
MAGVGHQRRRIAEIAIERLRDDQRGIQRYADRKRPAEARGSMDMRAAMMVGVAVAVMVVMSGVVVVTVHFACPSGRDLLAWWRREFDPQHCYVERADKLARRGGKSERPQLRG